MTDGELIARGRTADVFALGTDRVARVYRDPIDCAAEAAVMRHLAAHGYPVPEVFAAEGPRMEMARIRGRTLAEEVMARPWRLRRAAHTLRELIERLAEVPVPPGLPEPLAAIGPATCLLHLDLHPLNVLLGPDGPVVIDWVNAAAGPAGVEVAFSYLLVTTSDAPAPRLLAPAVQGVQRAFGRMLLPPRDPSRAHVPTLARYRLRDRNVLPAERLRLQRLLT